MRIGVAGAAILLAGCGVHAPTDRPSARSWVLLVADGVRVADAACAIAARDAKRADVAATCAQAYSVARSSLLAAEAAVDAYDNGGASQWGCALRDALVGLSALSAGIGAAGGKVPVAVVDGLSVGSGLSGAVCGGGR